MNNSRLILSVGFISLSSAIIVAALNPATGYEESIYSATPRSVWPLLVIALISGISKAWSRRSATQSLAISLLAGSILTIVYLPYIRGYQYIGEHDSLSQLGWARSLKQGTVGATDLFYPILHSLSVSFSTITGMSLERSLLLVLFMVVTIYPLGITLVIGELCDHRKNAITSIAVVSGLLLLPIVLIRVPVLQPIPATISILFFPVAFYVCLRSFENQAWEWKALFFITMTSMLFLHPQQSFNLSVVIFTLFVCKIAKARLSDTPSPSYSLTWTQISFLGVIIIGWISIQPAFVRLVTHILGVISSPGALDASAGGGGGNGGQPDVNLPLIIAKVFTISAIYVLIASIYSLKSLIAIGRSAISNEQININTTHYRIGIISVSITPLALLTLLFFISGRTNQIFRYVGLGLVFATILGSISIYRTYVGFSAEIGEGRARKGLQVSLLILLLISIPIVYPSTYISKPTDHVSEHQLSGYESAFEYTNNDRKITALYSPTDRYRDAVLGRQESQFGIGAAPSTTVLADEPPPVFNSSGNVSEPYYMIITESDRYNAIYHYQEHEYTRSQFKSLNSTENISHIYSNGEFSLFLIHDRSDSIR